jgi:hypothetical protein
MACTTLHLILGTISLLAGFEWTYCQAFISAGTCLADAFVVLAFLSIPASLAVMAAGAWGAFGNAVAI